MFEFRLEKVRVFPVRWSAEQPRLRVCVSAHRVSQRCACGVPVVAAQVSRRKGHLYRLFIEPDFEMATPKPRLPLDGVYSNTICVTSKRKTGERVVASQIRHEAVRHWIPALNNSVSVDVSNSLKALMEQIAVLSRSLDSAVSVIQAQVRPVARYVLNMMECVVCVCGGAVWRGRGGCRGGPCSQA